MHTCVHTSKDEARMLGLLPQSPVAPEGIAVGANLFQRQGVFRPLVPPPPDIVRVPGLRNIAATAPYFHDGSAATLAEAVHRMARAQLNASLSDVEVEKLVAFLGTLTGEYRGVPVRPAP